jgi:hypothetical protein
MDKIEKFIENENTSVLDENVNLMTVKQDGYNFTFKCPVNNGKDYWVLQHYKMKDIKDIPVNDR